MQYEFHPAANIFPLIEGAKFDELVKSIKTNGLRLPIMLHPDGRILDGRNRYRACWEAGIEPRFETWDGIGLAVDFVWDLNGDTRRHLDEGALMLAAARYAIEREGEARERQGARTDLTSSSVEDEVDFGKSSHKAAEKFGLSHATVERAIKVEKHGDESLKQAVEAGKASVSAAAEVATLSKTEQADIVARGEDEIIKQANKIKAERKAKAKQEKEERRQAIPADIPKLTERYRLIVSDVRSAIIEQNSIDCIITDPPYPREFLPTFSDLADMASEWLKPGGSMLIMSGQSWLPEVLANLNSFGLTYHWTLAYLTPGGQATQIFPRRVNTFWKPVFWFVKDEYKGDWIGDVTKSDVNDNDKRFHEWGQSESGMADLIDRISLPGQTILDPFCGGGTTGIVALKMNRLFIGIDIDESHIKTTAARLREITNVG